MPRQMSALKVSQYECLLKEELSCFRCDQAFKTMPRLKEHLQEEWEKQKKRAQTKESRESQLNNKRPAEASPDNANEGTKRQKSSAPSEAAN
jgi:aprataxin